MTPNLRHFFLPALKLNPYAETPPFSIEFFTFTVKSRYGVLF